MAEVDPVFESLQCLQSMMESFDGSLAKLCKDNRSQSALDLRKNLMGYYHDLLKALQSRYETLKIKEKKPEYEALKIKEEKPEEPGTRGKYKKKKNSNATVSSPNSSLFTKVLSSVEVGSEIKTLCDKADGRGLINHITKNRFRKEVEILRNELPAALSKAPDAAKLVLKALEGYDFSKSGSNVRERMESLCSSNRRACILLLESLFPVFGHDDSGVVPSDVKDSAREIAKVWRKEMKIEKDPESASPLDVHAFLQLLVTFRIAADYEMDDIWGLVLAISRRKETPELCRLLGLSSKVPDLLDKLSKSGRPITALKFARAFGMMDKVDPVDLLTSYLRDAEKDAKELLTNGPDSAMSQNDSNTKKMSAVKNAINIIKEYGLQCQSFEDKLQKKLRALIQRRKDLKKNRKKDAKKNTLEKEDRKKAAQKRIQRKRRQSSELGYGPSERKNYASKRAKHASPNETTRVAGGMGNSKASPYNIDRVQDKSGIIGHDHHTSSFIPANRSSTGLASGAFTSAPSVAAQINDERRRHPLVFGTSNLTPIGSSLYGSGAPAGAFADPLPNVADVNYEGRGQQSHTMNFGVVDKNHVRASVYGTGDLAKSSATQSNQDYEGRGQQSYKLNFGEVYNNPVSASAYGTGISAKPSGTQSHYESRGLELNTSAFGDGNMGSIRSSVYGTGDLAKSSANQSNQDYEGRGQQSYKSNFGEVLYNNPVTAAYGTGILANPSSTRSHYERRGPELNTSASSGGNTGSIGSSVYGSNSQTFPSSDVNRASAYGTGILANPSGSQSHYERRGPELYASAFGGGNMGSIGSSVHGSNSHTIPSSDVNQGGHERGLGQYSGFSGRNMVPIESSGYGPGVFPQYHLPM